RGDERARSKAIAGRRIRGAVLRVRARRDRRGRAALAVAAVRDDRVVPARGGESAGGVLHGTLPVASASPGGGGAVGPGARVTLGAETVVLRRLTTENQRRTTQH